MNREQQFDDLPEEEEYKDHQDKHQCDKCTYEMDPDKSLTCNHCGKAYCNRCQGLGPTANKFIAEYTRHTCTSRDKKTTWKCHDNCPCQSAHTWRASRKYLVKHMRQKYFLLTHDVKSDFMQAFNLKTCDAFTYLNVRRRSKIPRKDRKKPNDRTL